MARLKKGTRPGFYTVDEEGEEGGIPLSGIEFPIKKKRTSHGPRKGGNYERKICKLISLWWTDQERDDIFWRTAGSGARSTVRGRKGQTTANSAGDMAALDPIGEPFLQFFLVEMKRGYPKGFDLLGLLDRPKSYQTAKQKKDTIYGWLDKIIIESRKENKFSLLIFQRNQGCNIACINGKNFSEFEILFGTCSIPYLLYIYEEYFFVMFLLEDFLSWISIFLIKKLAEKKEDISGKD